MSNVNLNNPEFAMFGKLCDDIGRIANVLENQNKPVSVNASLLGTVSGFADWLAEALDTEDGYRRAQKLREILQRTNELRKFYQKELDKENEPEYELDRGNYNT